MEDEKNIDTLESKDEDVEESTQEEIIESKDDDIKPTDDKNLETVELNDKKEEILLLDSPKEEKKKLSRKEKKRLKKERKNEKIRAKILGPDITFTAPLSYRHLRLIGWISLALSQLIILDSINSKLNPESPFLSEVGTYFIDAIASLSIPLFMIAVFATILNKNKSYKMVISFYFAVWFLLGFGIAFAYMRYAKGLVNFTSALSDSIHATIKSVLERRAEINVFGDLLAMSLFHYFITYTPKKLFKGKKIYIFRLFSLLPLFVALISYIIKVRAALGTIDLPFEIYPFLTTKPPFIYLLFISLSLWIKKRQKRLRKIGITKSEYETYMKTKRNALSFSAQVSIRFLIISLLDLIILIGFVVVFGILFVIDDPETAEYGIVVGLSFAQSFEFGECVGLFIAIPFILLFNYTKRYKNSSMDIIVPLIGISLIAFVYLEGGYQIIIKLLSGS